MKTVFLRAVTFCSLVHVYRRFGEPYLPNVTEDRNIMTEVSCYFSIFGQSECRYTVLKQATTNSLYVINDSPFIMVLQYFCQRTMHSTYNNRSLIFFVVVTRLGLWGEGGNLDNPETNKRRGHIKENKYGCTSLYTCKIKEQHWSIEYSQWVGWFEQMFLVALVGVAL
jgi:hypothetical protein